MKDNEIAVIMCAAEAASRQVCCGRSVTVSQETGRRIPQRGLHVSSAALDVEDPLNGFAEPFQDAPRNRQSGVELFGHSVLARPLCCRSVPANDNSNNNRLHFTTPKERRLINLTSIS